MEDYPSLETDPVNGFAGVQREELRFDVIINPCLVTTLETQAVPVEVEYIVGNIQKAVSFSMTQAPCSYDASYTLVDKNTGSEPSFIEQLERFPIFNIYTTNENDVGNYTMVVTMTLDNLQLFSELDPGMDDYIADINNPPSGLLYQVTFEFDLEVQPPESEYEEPDNTNPYLLPAPVSQTLEIGAERVDYFLGNIYDNEISNQTVTLTVEIESRAQKFLEWRRSSNELVMRGTEADVNDLGQYDIVIKVEDNFATVEIEGYVECADREFKTEALKEQCKDRVNGVWYYNITVTVVEPPSDDDLVILPEAEEVFIKYDGRVYDLGNTTIEEFVLSSDETIVEITEEQLEESFELRKIEKIDIAAQ